MKYLGILIVVSAVLVLGYYFKQPTLINDVSPDTAKQSHLLQQTQQATHTKDAHEHGSSKPVGSEASSNGDIPEGKTGNPHFDQLTPQMQQAVKDSLLLEGPMKTYKRADGAIVLPANGRFTQMPVAVEMPDGSIQIREYTVTPDAQPKSAK
jgi:hypothetical protein